MKIAVVGLRGIPDVMGGIETHCQQLYPRLLNLDNSLDIIVIGRSPYVDSKPNNYQGILLKSIWTIKNKFFETIIHTFLSVIYTRFFLKADVIHIHAIGPGLFSPLARLLGMKVIFTHHGADYNRQKWNAFSKFLLKFGEFCALKCAHKIIVVGKSLTHSLKLKYSHKKNNISFIPNGVLVSTTISPTFDSESFLKTLNINSGEYILFVGRLVPEKGVLDLIEAYKISHSKLKLVIVGSSDHKDTFYQALVTQACDNIIFAGFRRGDELKALYKHANLFVLPSYHEGLPIVLLEAIGHGIPVLASNITPNLDVNLPESCYFDVGKINELSDKLNVDNTNTNKVNRAKYSELFNWDNIAKHTYSQFSYFNRYS